MKRIGYVCAYCGSNEVLLDAWAEWDVNRQDWTLHDTAATAYCRTCDGETLPIEVELASASTT